MAKSEVIKLNRVTIPKIGSTINQPTSKQIPIKSESSFPFFTSEYLPFSLVLGSKSGIWFVF
jgi:hypothetical protein